ncbi:MAG: ribonuclease J [Clostridia bacterium]|nr:ribonuclease J [Clostridia bacterium]
MNHRGSKSKHQLKIIPLGGVGEIGKNLTVLEYGDDILIIDCGMSFPDDEMPGIDAVIPDMTYLETNMSRIRGMLITHGHEDHIGAIPYAMMKFRCPIYGTRFTNALIRHKLEEHKINDVTLVDVSPGDVVTLGSCKAEFIKTGHSIAGACALAITTPIGTVIHTGDFKIDLTPMDGEPIDVNRFAYFGTRGVLALLSDSTNVERPGITQTEREIGKTFESCFSKATGRVIVATFASNVYRMQQVADVAIEHGRVVCFQGRSMEQIVKIAQQLGYMHIPEDKLVKVDQLKNFRDDEICVMTTGSQGEPMSGLFRMANATHRLNVGKGDTVIISASAIPGNELGVARVINQLYEKGATVVYDQMADVHVSGHACREELKLMMALTKPKYFIPVHGEARHLRMHADLAVTMGVDAERVFVPQLGTVITLTARKGSVGETVPSGSVMVDGLANIEDAVLHDRKLLSEDGLVLAIITMDGETGRICAPVEIISRGFVYMRDAEKLIAEATKLITEEAGRFEGAEKSEYSAIKNSVKSRLKSYLYGKTHRNPMILPITIEI